MNFTFSTPISSKNSLKCFFDINLDKGVEFSVSVKIPYFLKGFALGIMIKLR